MEEKRRSIQDIIPPARSQPVRQQPREKVDTSEEAPTEKTLPLKPNRSKQRNSFVGLVGIAIGVIVVIGIAFGVVSTFFHRAEITLSTYGFQVSISDTFLAAPDGEKLSYNQVSFETTATKAVASTGSEFVEERASGTITVFNEYSTQPQRLITNTRFETPEGLIYRVKSPITVPGYTTSGGEKVPGTIEAVVYADEAGENYNIPSANFTIPGLAGSPQFNSMYARSNGAMAGGFVGQKAVVDEDTRDFAAQELRSELDRSVRAGLNERLASNQFILTETVTIEFVDEPDRATDIGAEVSIKAIARAPAFNENQVAALLAENGGVVFTAPLTIANRESVTIQAQPSETNSQNLELIISGDVQLVAVLDTDQFIRDIAGKSQDMVGSVLTRYPGIKDLNLSVYPFWRQTLPEDEDRFSLVFDE